MKKWIKTSFSLPHEGERVLCYDEATGTYSIRVAKYNGFDGDVTHWKPLITPAGEEQNEDEDEKLRKEQYVGKPYLYELRADVYRIKNQLEILKEASYGADETLLQTAYATIKYAHEDAENLYKEIWRLINSKDYGRKEDE